MAAILTTDELIRARKVAAMLSSDRDGEAMNALAVLKRLADAKRIRVDELLAMLSTGPPAPREPNLAARLSALRRIDEARLSAWEQDFVDSILARARGRGWKPSEKQDAIIDRIIEEKYDPP